MFDLHEKKECMFFWPCLTLSQTCGLVGISMFDPVWCVQQHTPTHCETGSGSQDGFIRRGSCELSMRGLREHVRGWQGKYHGIKSKFPSKYAPPSTTAPSLYKQDLGQTVSIHGDHPFFLSFWGSWQKVGQVTEDKHYRYDVEHD